MQIEMNKTPRSPEVIHGFLNNCERRRYVAKAVVIAQGEVSRGLHFLIKGAVTFRMRTASGHDLVLDIAHDGSFFGEAGLFEADALNCSAVRAKSPCEVAFISYPRLRAYPALLAALLPQLTSQLAQRLDDLSRKTAAMAFYDTEKRVVSALQQLASSPDAHAHPEGSAISVTRTELGCMTGASREAVGRVLIRLQARGTLRAKGRAIVMLTGTQQRDMPTPSMPAMEYRSSMTSARL